MASASTQHQPKSPLWHRKALGKGKHYGFTVQPAFSLQRAGPGWLIVLYLDRDTRSEN